MPQELSKSIVFDEVNATLKRVKIIEDNSNDPVDVFLAAQVEAILTNVTHDIKSTLNNPALESTAEEFVKVARENKDLPKP